MNNLNYKLWIRDSRLNLFIALNVVVFVIIKLISVFEFLFRTNTGIGEWIILQLAVPAFIPALPEKFWTPFTYMFVHAEFFHILFNMLWLFWMGKIFTDFLKQRQFVFVYLAGGIAGALLFILAYNSLPAFKDSIQLSAPLIGASASVMAVVVATATLVPDYSIMLFLFGEVRLKYLAFAYIVLSLIDLLSNPGGSFAHLGGALFGFIFIKQLQKGHDWSKIFEKRQKLKIVRNPRFSAKNTVPDQDVIDNILDKISKSGYDSLTKFEKEQLFNASKKKEQ